MASTGCLYRGPDILPADDRRTALTWIGHSTFLLQIGGLNLIGGFVQRLSLGLTTAVHFTRERRCTLKDSFRFV